MWPFSRLEAKAVPLPFANIDTDQIMPKQFLTTVERKGLGRGLFYDLRFDEAGRERPEFVLNRPEYKGAAILITGDNFGCGSSREHAPWALMDFGIRCVISTGFADIFNNNCSNNGLLTVVLHADEIQQLTQEAIGERSMTVDLPSQTVTAPSGRNFHFAIDPGRKTKLLNGLDAIRETLKRVQAIDVYERNRASVRSWIS